MTRDILPVDSGSTYPQPMGGTSTRKRGRTRPQGAIDALPSGSLRVRVYAGVDILTKRKLYLTNPEYSWRS
jgi:integrase